MQSGVGAGPPEYSGGQHSEGDEKQPLPEMDVQFGFLRRPLAGFFWVSGVPFQVDFQVYGFGILGSANLL